MSSVTNVTKTDTSLAVKPANEVAFDEYISYCALGGVITDDDGTTHKMTVDQFCQTYGVTRMTLSRWKRQTPDWGERVLRRLDEIMPAARVAQVWTSMYLIARQLKDKRSAVEAGKLILGHNGMRLPTQRQELKVEGNFLDMMAAASREGIVEGEVVDEPTKPQEIEP